MELEHSICATEFLKQLVSEILWGHNSLIVHLLEFRYPQ
jgi:hypothetical protein